MYKTCAKCLLWVLFDNHCIALHYSTAHFHQSRKYTVDQRCFVVLSDFEKWGVSVAPCQRHLWSDKIIKAMANRSPLCYLPLASELLTILHLQTYSCFWWVSVPKVQITLLWSSNVSCSGSSVVVWDVLWGVLCTVGSTAQYSAGLCCIHTAVLLPTRGYIRPSSCIVTQGQMISFLGTLPRIDLVCLTWKVSSWWHDCYLHFLLIQ